MELEFDIENYSEFLLKTPVKYLFQVVLVAENTFVCILKSPRRWVKEKKKKNPFLLSMSFYNNLTLRHSTLKTEYQLTGKSFLLVRENNSYINVILSDSFEWWYVTTWEERSEPYRTMLNIYNYWENWAMIAYCMSCIK